MTIFLLQIPEIDIIMEPMMPIEAMQLYLFVRKKQYRVFYSLAFQNVVDKLAKYCEVRLLLLLAYEMMLRENDIKPRWWPQIIQSFLQVGDNITESNEVEIRKVLTYALNRPECNHPMRTDIARLSLRTFQYMPEVLNEIFKDRNYVPPQEIISILIEHLLMNKNESWSKVGLELLVTPVSEVTWRTFRPDVIEQIAGLCTDTVRQVLYKKSGRVPAVTPMMNLLPPPMPPQSLLEMEMDVDPEDAARPYSPTEERTYEIHKKSHQPSALQLLMEGQQNPVSVVVIVE